jgi:hypothetical protein
MAGKKKVKRFIVWDNHGYGEWSHSYYDTLEEALNHNSYGSEHILTKEVDYSVKEVEELPPSGRTDRKVRKG